MTPTPEARAEIYRLALDSVNHLPISAEAIAAGTPSCRLQVYRTAMMIDTQVNLPSGNPAIAGLVRALSLLLPNTP